MANACTNCLHSNTVQNIPLRVALPAACLAAECAYGAHLVIQRRSLTHRTGSSSAETVLHTLDERKHLRAIGSWRRSAGASLVSLARPQLVLQKLQGALLQRVRQDANDSP